MCQRNRERQTLFPVVLRDETTPTTRNRITTPSPKSPTHRARLKKAYRPFSKREGQTGSSIERKTTPAAPTYVIDVLVCLGFHTSSSVRPS